MQKRNLRRHERLHTEMRQYECCVASCKRRFSRRSDLRVHEERHSKMDSKLYTGPNNEVDDAASPDDTTVRDSRMIIN